MSKPDPLGPIPDAKIPGHAKNKWSQRSTETSKSLREALREALSVHSPRVFGRAFLHSPTGTIIVVRRQPREGWVVKTVLRDDGDVPISERDGGVSTRLVECGVCGNEHYGMRGECPWCHGTGVVS